MLVLTAMGWIVPSSLEILTLFSVTSLIIYLTYNLYFHPLANIPGPFWARVSSIPSFYHALRRDRHLWIWQNFQIYEFWLGLTGSKIRIMPDTVVWCDPDAYHSIYNMKANVQRSPFYKTFARHEYDKNTVTTIDVAEHAKRRRWLAQAFSDKSVNAAANFVVKHVDRWHELVAPVDEAEWSTPLNMSEWADAVVMDILGDLCFGRSFDVKEPGENPLRAMPAAKHRYVKFLYPITRSPFLGLLLYLKPRGFDRLIELLTPPEVHKYYDFVTASVRSRIELQASDAAKPDEQQRRDIFHFLCKARDDQGRPAYDERALCGEANMLIVAGSDTTATALCGTLFYLTRPRYDQVYRKLVQEIEQAFPSVGDIVPGPALARCEYLRAVIDEGMRVCPSGTTELPREVRPGGHMVNGEFFPAGTIVGSPNWSMNRSDAVFHDPHVFRPERWIACEAEGRSAEGVALARRGFNPFSQGPAACPGRALALMEMQLVLARTLHRFDVRRAPGQTVGEGRPELNWGRRDPDTYQLHDAYLSMRDGPYIQIRKRK